MHWVVIFVMTIAAMGFLMWPLIRDTRSGNGRSPALWILAFIVPMLALGLARFLRDDQTITVATSPSLNSIAWPGEATMTQPAAATTRPAAESSATSVAPVPSLIAGLRARLDENPEDVKGWALMAQSYAFIGDGPGAEEAITRAVELGFDETDLRNRVELAFQSSRTPNESSGPTPVPGIIHGVVKLAPDANLQLSPNHRLFVFAKATDGSTVPVAVIRRQVNEFPFTFALSNRESMAPGVSLTDFDQVMVSARLSASGTAERGDGDIQSNVQIVRVATPDWVELVIGG